MRSRAIAFTGDKRDDIVSFFFCKKTLDKREVLVYNLMMSHGKIYYCRASCSLDLRGPYDQKEVTQWNN